MYRSVYPPRSTPHLFHSNLQVASINTYTTQICRKHGKDRQSRAFLYAHTSRAAICRRFDMCTNQVLIGFPYRNPRNPLQWNPPLNPKPQALNLKLIKGTL